MRTPRFPAAWDRWDFGALAALAVVSAATTFLNARAVTLAGLWEDDGVYLVTAQALAEDRGYRRIDLPDEPRQTKYPILYPFVLSLVWRLFSRFPDNLIAIQILNGLFAWGAAFLAYRLARRAWGLPPWLAAAGALVAAARLPWADLAQYAMSEPCYAFLSLAALACLRGTFTDNVLPAHPAQPQPPRQFAAAFWSGFFAAAAYLCRSIGVAVIAAVLAGWLLRKRPREALLAAVVPALALGGWTWWRQTASAANAERPHAAALAFDLNYDAWLPRDAAQLGRTAYLNVSAVAWSLAQCVIEPKGAWFDRAARGDFERGDSPYSLAALAAILISLTLLLIGLAATFRLRASAAHLYLLFYGGLILLWPFRPDRFLVPILPLLILPLLAGLWRGLGWLRDFFLPPEPGADEKNSAAFSSIPKEMMPRDRFVAGLALLFALYGLNGNYHRTLGALAPHLTKAQAEREAAADLLQKQTPPDAVIATTQRGHFFLRTGRRCVPPLPYDNPYELYFPPDRNFWSGGRAPVPGGAEALRQVLEERGLAYYRAVGARYVLMADDGGLESQMFARFAARRGDCFYLVGSAGPYRLWQILPPR